MAYRLHLYSGLGSCDGSVKRNSESATSRDGRATDIQGDASGAHRASRPPHDSTIVGAIMATLPSGMAPVEAPLSHLERALIDEFIRARGYDTLSLSNLPAHEREMLLREASLDASTKLAEVESRSHLVHDLHDGLTDAAKTGL